MRFTQMLSDYLSKEGVCFAELARRCKVHGNQPGLWLQGKVKPSTKTIIVLAKLLGRKPSEVWAAAHGLE